MVVAVRRSPASTLRRYSLIGLSLHDSGIREGFGVFQAGPAITAH